MTKAGVTKNTLHFDASGPSGSTGWINVTFPMINTTNIKVFINKEKLTPPPFPIIEILNETHYFIYFEFNLSTHGITIQFANVDIGITDVMPCKTVVGEEYALNVNVTLQNQGDNEETFNLTLYANTTIIKTITNITLTSGNTTTIAFTWDAIGWSKGNYTINATITIPPWESNAADNSFTYSSVFVTIPGDVDGDRDVDIFDIIAMIGSYGSEIGDPAYNPNYDIDGDGDIDIFDIVIACNHYGESW